MYVVNGASRVTAVDISHDAWPYPPLDPGGDTGGKLSLAEPFPSSSVTALDLPQGKENLFLGFCTALFFKVGLFNDLCYVNTTVPTELSIDFFGDFVNEMFFMVLHNWHHHVTYAR